MNITGSSLSSWWYNRLPEEDLTEEEKEKKFSLEVL
jgi:hypothetical protein